MRDLGLMGESTFSLWCADAGLIPNGSQIDKTGWDFLVESPFSSDVSARGIHKSAFECRVQVKATDKNDRKLPVTLSNLRRLVTAQIPAFFVFIEFDGGISAQRAFVVHVDNTLITKVLKKLHEIEQSEKNNNFNKRKMTIHYDERNLLEELDGKNLKSCLLKYVGNNVADYIAKKKNHLESAGYEDGVAKMTFFTEEDKLKELIDVSLGFKKEVEVLNLKGADTRFGILSATPFFDAAESKLSMPDLKPKAEGKVRFRENKLSAWLSFNAAIYISPFHTLVSDRHRKIRVKCEFFDLTFIPPAGDVSFSFSLGEGLRLEVKKFRDALKLAYLLSSSGKKVSAELIFDGLPKSSFSVDVKDCNFTLLDELKALESATRTLAAFEMTDFVDISLDEISRNSNQILQIENISICPLNSFNIEFGLKEEIEPDRDVACIFLISAPIGSHIFGVILILIGNLENTSHGRHRLAIFKRVIEQRIVSEADQPIPHEDLAATIECIERKYENEFTVIRMYEQAL